MKKDIESFDAAQELMEERLNALRDTIMGRNNSFLPFITDNSGRVTNEKLDLFIKELSDGVFQSGMKGIIRNPEFIEACECFLYCTIQGIAEYDNRSGCVIRGSSEFSDIVSIARHKNNLLFLHKDFVQESEYDTEGDDDPWVRSKGFFNKFQQGGFLRSCDIAFWLLTGKYITSTFDEKDIQRCYYKSELEQARMNGFDTIEAYELWLAEIEETENSDEVQAISDECSEADPERDAFFERIQAYSKKINDEWCSNVVSPEKFVERYLRYRELFFRMDPEHKERLFEYIEGIVDYFLYDHNMSALSEVSNAAMTDRRIEKLCTVVKQSIKGAVKNDKE